MFGIGMPEMILILALALIVIGPKKLPDLAKSMGRAFREFKKATSEIKDSMGIDNELQDVKSSFNEIQTNIKESVDLAPSVEKEADDKAPPAKDEATDQNKSSSDKPENELERLKSAFDEMDEEQKALFSEPPQSEKDPATPLDLPDPPKKEEKDT